MWEICTTRNLLCVGSIDEAEKYPIAHILITHTKIRTQRVCDCRTKQKRRRKKRSEKGLDIEFVSPNTKSCRCYFWQ